MSVHTPGPVFSIISDDGDSVRYRIEGGEVAPNWRRDGKHPWCEFSIWHDGRSLSSYGGEVWPMAYPDFFRRPVLAADAIDHHPSHVELTDRGLAAVREVRAEHAKARGP